jgi:hypothetical protein
MKKLIRLTESDLHKIVKESAKRIMKEVALKGKSGKTYSLHGNDEESWDIMTNLRQNQKGGHGVTQYNTSRNAKNAEEMDAKNHPNRRSLNNANRVKASLKRTSDASKDIMAANESKLSRIVKESVNRILNEINLTNKQIRNITGISDDDELNAACMAEDEDDLESNIVKDLKDEYGFYNVYDKGVVLDFNFIKELLKQKYGMNYLGFDEKDDSHLFKNNDFVVKIWSKENYPRLSKFHLQNIHVYHA